MTQASLDLLIDCLEDIRAGRRTVESCAAAHPEIASDLAALAPLALPLRPIPWQLGADTKARARAGMMAAIAHNGHGHADKAALAAFGVGRPKPLAAVLGLPMRGLEVLRGLAPAAVAAHPWVGAVTGAVGAALAGGAVVYAAQGAPPDSVLFPVHRAVQAVSQAVGVPVATATPSPEPSPTATVAVIQASAAAPGPRPRGRCCRRPP
jgi:hypothetical protein